MNLATKPEIDALALLEPRPGRLIVNRPRPLQEEGPRKLRSGLYAPAQEERVRREFGCSALVLKVCATDTHGIAPGDEVIIPEYGGTPLYWDRELPYWIIGEGDVMAVITT